jgi:hypothetical protein
MNKSEPNQWHGTFATTARSESAEFVALLRVGSDCGAKAGDATATRIPGGWEVKASGKTVDLLADNVTVK